jgi:hypothetical protein
MQETSTIRLGLLQVDTGATERELHCLSELAKWYSEQRISELLQPLGHPGGIGVSLRALEWFVTNYARRKCVFVSARVDGDVVPRRISSLYRQSLAVYGRRLFDPFNRSRRVLVEAANGEVLKSSCGQLNFIHWAEENGVIAMARSLKLDLEHDMSNLNKRKSHRRRGRPCIHCSALKHGQRHRCRARRFADFAESPKVLARAHQNQADEQVRRGGCSIFVSSNG